MNKFKKGMHLKSNSSNTVIVLTDKKNIQPLLDDLNAKEK